MIYKNVTNAILLVFTLFVLNLIVLAMTRFLQPACFTTCPEDECTGTAIEPATVQSWLAGDGYVEDSSTLLDTFRLNVELKSVSVECHASIPKTDQCQSIAFFNGKLVSQNEASLNVLKTIFIMVVLMGISILFSRDAERLVIRPIQRMVSMVREVISASINLCLRLHSWFSFEIPFRIVEIIVSNWFLNAFIQ